MTFKGLPDTLSTQKVIAYLKSCKVDMTNMPNRKYMYALGRNTLADVLLVAVYCGEMDEVEK